MSKRFVASVAWILTAGCFPTFQSARIEPGFRIDASMVVLGDQQRSGEAQGIDGMLTVAPVYGFGERLELGLPVGIYWEEGIGRRGYATGTQSQNLVVLPYAKLALHEPTARDHLALIVQASGFLPGNIGVRYGRDLGKWEPQVGLTWIISGGPAGDDPVITRYQELDQSLFAASIGATWRGHGRPSIEVGVLRNSYREGAVYGDFGQETVPRTLYDLFVGIRAGL
jgi:hypothetical protein